MRSLTRHDRRRPRRGARVGRPHAGRPARRRRPRHRRRRPLRRAAPAAERRRRRRLGRRRRLRRGRLPERDRDCRHVRRRATPTTAPPTSTRCAAPGPAWPACPTPPPGTAGTTNWVQVTTSTHNPANSNPTQVKFLLAPVLDAANVGRTVHASAVAAWGPVGGATTIPFTFSVCEFEALGGSLDGSTFPDHAGLHLLARATVRDHTTAPATPRVRTSPAASAGWTRRGLRGRRRRRRLGRQRHRRTACRATATRRLANARGAHPPLRRRRRGSGSDAEYHIVGFAGFKVLGYKFGNDDLEHARRTASARARPATADAASTASSPA